MSWDVVLDSADYFQNLRTLVVLLMSTEYTGSCYQHLSDVICKGIIPICDPIRNVSVPLCREMCYGLMDSCVEKIVTIIAKQNNNNNNNNLLFVIVLRAQCTPDNYSVCSPG